MSSLSVHHVQMQWCSLLFNIVGVLNSNLCLKMAKLTYSVYDVPLYVQPMLEDYLKIFYKQLNCKCIYNFEICSALNNIQYSLMNKRNYNARLHTMLCCAV
jgi:hypothetical protein